MAPASVRGKEIEEQLLREVYAKKTLKNANIPKFKAGDHVRISKYKAQFAKGYCPSWSTEIFKVAEVKNTIPITYHLKDYKGQMIAGGFYQEELQLAKHPDSYLVEKVIKRKGDRILVKWLGLDNSHNSWENVKNVHI